VPLTACGASLNNGKTILSEHRLTRALGVQGALVEQRAHRRFLAALARISKLLRGAIEIAAKHRSSNRNVRR
jgi:hypothetical protein